MDGRTMVLNAICRWKGHQWEPCNPYCRKAILCEPHLNEYMNRRIKEGSTMDELADIVIRVADLAETLGGNLEEAVQTKLAYNRTRPYQYGTPTEERRA